jgi:2-polyprenyl-3-methyl-5-hydroxy-6-metoxy-1,4-benzoquinol methylase
MPAKHHWERFYRSRSPEEVSWYQPHARMSLALIHNAGITRDARIIDVGGGASMLVDDLLADGYDQVTVLDLSRSAVAAAQRRLGGRAAAVTWLEADILDAAPALHGYDLWHDRAVFHFLTDAADRRRYVDALLHAVKASGHVTIATFAEDGPATCSGLPVTRYGIGALDAEVGDAFELLEHAREIHRTPAGTEQPFVYGCWRKRHQASTSAPG